MSARFGSLRSPASLRVAPVLLFALAIGCNGSSSGDGGDGDGDGGATTATPFFLPTVDPDNTSAPTIELDADGGIHAVYPAYAGGGAYYAYCPASCAGPDQVSVVALPTDGTTANAMLALDAEGQPRVLLSAYQYLYYAAPQGDFRDPAAWKIAQVLDHESDREVTGEAFALDANGRPTFLMHTYIAYLGIGQKTPETHFVTCDGDCFDPAGWGQHKVADQIWEATQLKYDAKGVAHVATVAHVVDEQGSTTKMGAYLACSADCTNEASWVGTGLLPAFENELEAVSVKPAIALALTSDDRPRVAMLAAGEVSRQLVYFACEQGCTAGDAWAGSILNDSEVLGAGIDMALDGAGHPRIAYTFDYNIGVGHCEADDCTAPDAGWDLAKVEMGSEMDPDEIFLYPNCNVGAWFLHSPSIALDAQGRARVGYQARDISGGWSNPDPSQPDCVAGTDMTWSRLAFVSSL